MFLTFSVLNWTQFFFSSEIEIIRWLFKVLFLFFASSVAVFKDFSFVFISAVSIFLAFFLCFAPHATKEIQMISLKWMQRTFFTYSLVDALVFFLCNFVNAKSVVLVRMHIIFIYWNEAVWKEWEQEKSHQHNTFFNFQMLNEEKHETIRVGVKCIEWKLLNINLNTLSEWHNERQKEQMQKNCAEKCVEIWWKKIDDFCLFCLCFYLCREGFLLTSFLCCWFSACLHCSGYFALNLKLLKYFQTIFYRKNKLVLYAFCHFVSIRCWIIYSCSLILMKMVIYLALSALFLCFFYSLLMYSMHFNINRNHLLSIIFCFIFFLFQRLNQYQTQRNVNNLCNERIRKLISNQIENENQSKMKPILINVRNMSKQKKK